MHFQHFRIHNIHTYYYCYGVSIQANHIPGSFYTKVFHTTLKVSSTLHFYVQTQWITVTQILNHLAGV